MNFKKVDIIKKSQELKSYISQFETVSFTTQICYALNSHLRLGRKIINIESPARQLLYLLSLFLSTEEKKGLKVFDLISGDFKYIEQLLFEIEKGYRYNSLYNLDENVDKERIRIEEVANSTYINYFVNAPLNYTEQEIDKIESTFTTYQDFILTNTHLELQDYLDFFDATEFIDQLKYQEYLKNTHTIEHLEIIQEIKEKGSAADSKKFTKLFNAVENSIFNLRIHKEELEFFIPSEKINSLYTIFSIKRNNKDNSDYLFYTQECPLMRKPLIELPDGSIIIPMQKQLIHSIYKYLFEICYKLDKSNRRILERRDDRLEEKTKDIFEMFFNNEAKIFSHYYIGNNEKDLLILYRNSAFIVECKANKYREPLFDTEKAYVRIKDDFKKSIQKGYEQALEVERIFELVDFFEIKDQKGEVVAKVNTKKYQNIFSIIVTQERLGQIQTDLGLLLEINENDLFPWSVYIDDLETFLITLSRKENYYGEFITYLHNREKLHTRLNSSDELELAALFLTQKEIFIKCCNMNAIFSSNPVNDRFFDELYQFGFGFKNERNLNHKIEKVAVNSHKIKNRLKELKLVKTPQIIREYKISQNQED